jgi:hypothetical protein
MVSAVDDPTTLDFAGKPTRSADKYVERLLPVTIFRSKHSVEQEAEARWVCRRERLQVENVWAMEPLQRRYNETHGMMSKCPLPNH